MLEAIAAHKEIGLTAAALSSVFWTLTYALILRRAARDRSYGMPLPALGANLAWEVTFLVVTLRRDPLDARLALLVPWTLLDFALVAQCLRYGRREATHPLLQRHYASFVVGSLLVAAAAVLGFVWVFDDAIGWYAAFTQNLMMSILFVRMLRRRGSARGQSIGIAVAKLLGTFFAFVLALGWSPPTLHRHWASLLPDRYTPIDAAILGLYAGVLAFDLLYVALLARQARESGSQNAPSNRSNPGARNAQKRGMFATP